MADKHGGAAFPQIETRLGQDAHSMTSYSDVRSVGGMTLRDYFAGQALAGMCGGKPWPYANDGPEMATRAYLFADAMLAEREAK